MATKDQDWVPLAPPASWQRIGLFGLAGSASFIFVTNISLSLVRPYFDGVLTPLTIAVAVGLMIEVLVILVAVQFNPVPVVNIAQRMIRIRRREVTFADITSASVTVEGSLKKPELLLTFGTRRAIHCTIYLRDRTDRPLPEPARQLMLIVLRESSIAAPSSPYDPERKFTRYNFPGHLEKDEAIALVELNPSARKPIPGIIPLR